MRQFVKLPITMMQLSTGGQDMTKSLYFSSKILAFNWQSCQVLNLFGIFERSVSASVFWINCLTWVFDAFNNFWLLNRTPMLYLTSFQFETLISVFNSCTIKFRELVYCTALNPIIHLVFYFLICLFWALLIQNFGLSDLTLAPLNSCVIQLSRV